MSLDQSDDELALALELSKKTYEEEAHRRLNNEQDLIRFESPEAPKTREKIASIIRLYNVQDSKPSSSAEIGWRSNLTHQPSSATHTQLPVYQPNLQKQAILSRSLSSTPTPASQSHTYRTDSLAYQNVAVTNGERGAVQGSFPPPPGFIPSVLPPPPPLYPRLFRRQSTIESLHPSSSTPACLSSQSDDHNAGPVLYPSPKLHLSNDTYSASHYDYVNSDLYVPYTMFSKTLQDGNLIDFGSSSSAPDCSSATFDQIQREFDPLFHPIARNETPIMAKRMNSHPVDNSLSGTPAIRAVPSKASGADENKENFDRAALSLDCIRLQSYEPPIFRQISTLRDRGRKITTRSSLNFTASTANYMTTAARSVKVVISTDYTWSQRKTISITCDTEASIDMIITEALADLLPESELSSGVPVEKYALKVFGLDECLSACFPFGHNLYVGQCLLHGRDVKLEISRIDSPLSESDTPLSPNTPYTLESIKSEIKYSSVLDKEDLENWKVHLEHEMAVYETSFNSSSTLSISASTNKVKQCVKMLCKMLNSIEPVNLHQHLHKYLTATTNEQLLSTRNDFIASLHSFISTYSVSTLSLYFLNPIRDLPKRKKEILDCTDKLKVMVNSMHNLSEEWLRDYTEFYVTVNIYYGTRLIDGHDRCISKTVKQDAFFPYVPMSVYVGFNHQLCVCPRETKIMLILSGVSHQSPSSTEQVETKKPLAYASVPLFDDQRLMRQGQLFIPLTVLTDAVLKPWGPYPLINNANDSVIIVTLPSYEYDVVFPEVSVETQCTRQDLSFLDSETQQYLMDLLEAGNIQLLSAEEQEVLWQKRSYLMNQPEALPLVLASVSDWGYGFLSNVYQILEGWVPLSPVQAMPLLLPQYPDVRIRQKAVEWILCASSDFLFNALPQLVEALRFEIFECSSTAAALLTLSYWDRKFAFEIYWQLQQRIDNCVDFAYAQRCSLLQKELLERHESDHLRHEIARQHWLLNCLDCLQMDLRRDERDIEATKLNLLRSRLGVLDSHLLEKNVRLPIIPSFRCSGVAVKSCSIFNSNAKPLKVVFRGLNSTYSVIHKSGDDMRQDALVLQMVGWMNDIWLREGLDLRIVLFRCMPVGYRKGMAELVSNCATLCDIQKESGVTGVFKDDILTNWIQKHNSTEFTYKMAMDNFTRSCAGWCVATYILGIGDRHNDNILVTTSGHVFHIDFGKYMGDWQTAAGFKRDRVPFVFTVEMYHVINGGNEQKENYQTFIDYCCRAFNYIRRSYSILTNILKIMACSDIAGVNIESLAFVENNLMLELSETDAVIQFTKLINESLRSAFPRINFFIHTLAQMMTGSVAKNDEYSLSFVPQLYSQASEGRITNVCVVSFEKRFLPSKVYLFKMEVTRAGERVISIVYRSFDEVHELYIKLRRRFPTVGLSALSAGTKMRSNVREVAQRRMIEIQKFFRDLYTLSNEISHCDLVYTFFHLILRDSNIDSYADNEVLSNDSGHSQPCQVYLKLQFNSNKRQLSVFVGHVKHLALLSSGQAPDAYVKTYVRPDPQSISKRKTQIVKSSQNPTFNCEVSYDIRLDDGEHLLATRVLEVSVWNSGGLMDNHKMYMVFIPLLKLKNQIEDRKGNRVLDGWFTCDKNV